jgi:hypothetical protein
MTLSPAAQALHRGSIVIDGLNISRWGDAEVYRHLHEGGLTAINASLAVWEGAEQTRANGDLVLTSAPLPPGGFYEDLCFGAQRATEEGHSARAFVLS